LGEAGEGGAVLNFNIREGRGPRIERKGSDKANIFLSQRKTGLRLPGKEKGKRGGDEFISTGWFKGGKRLSGGSPDSKTRGSRLLYYTVERTDLYICEGGAVTAWEEKGRAFFEGTVTPDRGRSVVPPVKRGGGVLPAYRGKLELNFPIGGCFVYLAII